MGFISNEMNNYEVCLKKLGWMACHESCALHTLTSVDNMRMITLKVETPIHDNIRELVI
jgi:hypothetical protein